MNSLEQLEKLIRDNDLSIDWCKGCNKTEKTPCLGIGECNKNHPQLMNK